MSENESEWIEVFSRSIIESLLNSILTKPIQNTFYCRKFDSLQAEVLSQFGQADLKSSLKCHYTKLELEKKKLHNDIVIKNKNIPIIDKEFLIDAKIHKSRIEIDKEQSKCILPFKRKHKNNEVEIKLKRIKCEGSLTDDIIIKKCRIEKDLEELRKINQDEAEARIKLHIDKRSLIKFENIDMNAQKIDKMTESAFMKRKLYSQNRKRKSNSSCNEPGKCQ